jgi:hypothetical protein
MARKLPGLTRVLGATPIASVAYSEIGSSVYFALGIVTLYALGLTPWVLLGVGSSSRERSTIRSASSPAGCCSSTT